MRAVKAALGLHSDRALAVSPDSHRRSRAIHNIIRFCSYHCISLTARGRVFPGEPRSQETLRLSAAGPGRDTSQSRRGLIAVTLTFCMLAGVANAAWAQARFQADDAATLVTKQGLTRPVAELLAKSRVAAQNNSYDEAVSLARRAIMQARQVNDRPGIALGLLRLTDVLTTAERVDEAVAVSKEALAASRSLNNRPLEIDVLSLQMVLQFEKREYDRVENILQTITEYSHASSVDIAFAEALLNASIGARGIGYEKESEILARAALATYTSANPDSLTFAKALQNAARCEQDVAVQLQHETRALDILLAIKADTPQVIEAYLVLSSILVASREPNRALEYARKALALTTKVDPMDSHAADALTAIASGYRALGAVDSSYVLLQKAISIYDTSIPGSEDGAVAKEQLAAWKLQDGDTRTADIILASVDSLLLAIAPKSELRAVVIGDRGIVAARAGKLEDAKQLFLQAKDLESRSGAISNTTLMYLAEIERYLHHPADAEAYARQALRQFEGEVASARTSEQLEEISRESANAVVELLISLVEQHRRDDAWTVFCEERGKTVLTTLGGQDLRELRRGASSARYRDALQAVYRTGTILSHAREDGKSSVSSLLGAQESYSRALAAADSLRSANVKYDAPHDSLLRVTVRPQDIPEESVLLAFMVGSEVTIGAVVWRDTNGPRADFSYMRVPPEYWRSLADTLLSAARDKVSAKMQDVTPMLKASRLAWENLFPDTLMSIVGRSKHLIIAPDGPMWDIPFSALFVPDKSGPKWLADGRSISLVATLEKEPPGLGASTSSTPRRALVIGDPVIARQLSPLVAARREAHDVADLYGTSPLTGVDASELTVRSRIETASVVHFATHSLLDKQWPMGSGLLLATGPEKSDHLNDGDLQAWEIAREFDISAQVVALSACQTGLGSVRVGAGVTNIQYAFLLAGASNVLGSLWNVNDEVTTTWMMNFYKLLQGGSPVPDAASNAASQVRAQREYRHPYYWASFRLMTVWKQ